jgi:nucleoside-diphosphate-sugar epimerase
MILVFGGNGFIGQHIARALLDAGEDVIVTTHSRSAVPVLLRDAMSAGAARAEAVDVTDPFAVMAVVAKYRPTVTIDATGHAPKALSPGRDVTFRVGALVNILEAARLNGVARVVLMSSMDAYWGLGRERTPYREEMDVPLLESSDHFIVQSWAKKSLEVIGNLYRRQHGMDIAFIRASGTYGPLYRTYLNVPSRLVRAAVLGIQDFGEHKGGIPVAEDGYDQVYVKDLARGVGLVALAHTLRHPVYNIGSGRAPTYAEFAVAAQRAVPEFKIALRSLGAETQAATRDSAMRGLWMDIGRAGEELGYEPLYSVDRAIAEYADWLRAHPE